MIERYYMDTPEDPYVKVEATPDKEGWWVEYDAYAAEIAKARKVIEDLVNAGIADCAGGLAWGLAEIAAEQWLKETEEEENE
jgi:hypothetical protein